MLAALNTLFIGVGVAAYASVHAYVLLVLKAPAAKAAQEHLRQAS